MNIWMSVCRRRGKCAYCKEYIEKESYMVVGKYWAKPSLDPNAARWAIKLRWHVECWVEQGKINASKVNEQKVNNRGRPRLSLSDEDKKHRTRLMIRRAVVVYRIRKVQEANPYDIDALVKLGTKLYDIKEEIVNYGGVPKSW